MAMISTETMRKRLRITHSLMDGDIESNIEAARLDMCRVGIDAGKDDALTDKAVELYCKAQFDYLGKGDQFLKHYEGMRDAISMAEAYQ